MEDILKILDYLSFISPKLVAVGGCVRDAILGIPYNDIDIASDITPDKLMSLLNYWDIDYFDTGYDHGTVSIVLPDKTVIEHTTFRKDVDCDGRHATVQFCDTFEEDARRRDFTINAIAIDRFGNFIDPFDGVKDLTERFVLKTVGKAEERFEEDFLRIMRAFRFLAKYKLFFEDQTFESCEELMPYIIDNVSKERILMELKKGLNSNYGLVYFRYISDELIYHLFPFLDFTEFMKGSYNKIIDNTSFLYFIMNVFKNASVKEINLFPFSKYERKMIKSFKSLHEDKNNMFKLRNRLEKEDVEKMHSKYFVNLFELSKLTDLKLKKIIQEGYTGKEINDQLYNEFLSLVD